MDWFILGLIATTLFGMQSFLYKTSAQHKQDPIFVTFIFLLTVCVLTFILSLVTLHVLLFSWSLLLFSTLFAVFFILLTQGHLVSLKYLPTHIVFPITTSNVLIVAILSYFIFAERISVLNAIGILVIVGSLIAIQDRAKKHAQYNARGFIIAFLSIIPAVGMNLVNKYSATHFDLISFVFTTYLIGSILLGVLVLLRHSTYTKLGATIGVGIGAVNFIGYFCFLGALQTGKISLLASMVAFSTLIVVVLSKVVHKERMTLLQFGLVVLSIVGIILLRF